MPGLLSDVLPYVYSQGNRAKRYLGGLLSDPLGEVQQTAGKAMDDLRALSELEKQSFSDRKNPVKVTNRQAFNNLSEKYMNGVMNFAPVAATVWHGSPHKFSKFDSSKIGTGEGAQAYGHGLYLAESPAVAQSYRNPAGNTAYTVDGKNAIDAAYSDRTLSKPIRYLQDFKGDMKSAMQAAIDDGRPEVASEIKKLFEAGRIKPAPEGSLYKVDLPDEAIAKMLDWDKPLSQQAPEVQRALETIGYKYNPSEALAYDEALLDALAGGTTALPNKMPRNPLGSEIARGAGIFDRPQDKVIAEKLRQAGIPGIRYLDGLSRDGAKGTSNFVVFPGNENILSILERNGQPLPGLLD